jgi:MFS family permease
VTTNWRWTFWINVPIGIVAFIVIAIYCPALKHEEKPRVDYAGAGLLALFLATLILAIDNTEQIFADVMTSTGLSLLGLRAIMFSIVALALVALIFVEKRAQEPIIELNFFKNRNFSIIMTIAFLHGAAFLGAILYLTQFNQQVFGATPTQSGLMLLPMIAGLMAASITAGQLVSRFGTYKKLIVAGFLVMTVSIAMLTTLTPTTGYMYEAIVMVFVGLGIGTAMPLMNIAVQNEFGQKDLGAATSASQLFRSLGSTIGTAIFGSILTLGVASNLGDMKNDAYIQTLKQSPASSQILAKTDDANTLLQLNTPTVKAKINSGFDQALLALPEPVRAPARATITANQDTYGKKIVYAFSDSINTIFIVSSTIVATAALISFAIKEKPLQHAKATDTPGEV